MLPLLMQGRARRGSDWNDLDDKVSFSCVRFRLAGEHLGIPQRTGMMREKKFEYHSHADGL